MSSDYIVIGSQSCPYCINAKKLLESKDMSYDYLMMNELKGSEVAVYENIAGGQFRTVPQIFKQEGENLTHVGGFTELAQSFRSI